MMTFLRISTTLFFTFILFSCSNSVDKIDPTLTFTDIDRGAHDFSEYSGKPLLVIFWATDCPGCVQEMPQLVKLYNHYSPQDFAMLGIAMQHDSLPHIKAMQVQKQLPYTLTWDAQSTLSQAFGNVRVTPTHFLIAPDGEIVMRKIGALNNDIIHNKLREMGVKPLAS